MFVFQICTGDRMSVSLGDPSISSIHRSFFVLHPYVYVFVLRYDHCHVPYQKYQKAHNKLRSACRQILILDKEASFLLWSMSQRPLAAGEDSILCFQIEGYSLTHVHLRDGVWTGMETYGSMCRCFGPLYYLVLLVQTSWWPCRS